MNTHKELFNVLDYLGFEEKEALLYVTSLKIGKPATAGLLSRRTQINRGTAYHFLYKLSKKGFMCSVDINGTIHFSSKTLDELQKLLKTEERKIEQKKEIIRNNSEAFRNIWCTNNYGGKDIELFQGKKGIEKMYKSLPLYEPHGAFSSTRPYEKVYPADTLYGAFSMDVLRQCSTRLLLTQTEGYEHCANIHKLSDSCTVKVYKQEEYPLANLVFDNCIVIVNFSQPLSGIKITNPLIVESHKALFENLWSYSKDI